VKRQRWRIERFVMVVVTLSPGFLVAACGANVSSGFVKRANGICADFYAKAYTLPPPLGLRELRAYPEKKQALLEGELSGLRALKPPVVERARYTGYVLDLGELDRQYSLIVGDLKSGPPSDLRLSVAERLGRRLSDLQATVEQDARDLRLAECAKDPYSAAHYASN
jgi:hypothetical protein